MRPDDDDALRILFEASKSLDLLPEHFRALDDALGRILSALARLPDLGRTAIFLTDPETLAPVLRAAFTRGQGLNGREAADPFGLSETALARSMAAGEPFFTPDRDGAGSFFVAPVPGEDRPVGCLAVDRLFSDAEEEGVAESLEFLGMIARIAGRLVSINRRAEAEREVLQQEILSLRTRVSESFHRLVSVGASRALERLRFDVERAALSDHPVFLHGDQGVGRELAARVVHELSRRAARTFAATTFSPNEPEALAAEIFGQRPSGSSDPSGPPRPGLLEIAEGGAVYLREPQIYPPDLQKRLARFLETGTFTRLGDDRIRRSDIRLMAGTVASPPSAAAPGGAFFEELLRLPRLERVHVPALKERPEDIAALVNDILGALTLRQGRKPSLTPAALKALENYDWPGNLRELEDALTRTVIAASDEKIDLTDIPPEILSGRKSPEVMPGDAADLKDIERRQIQAALDRHDWNQSRAARELGLTLRQIGYRIKKYGLSRV